MCANEVSLYQPNRPLQWNWITLNGPDAQDFLHRLTTLNVSALEIGQGASGCFLTAQAKVQAHFTLWKYAPDEFAFEFDGGESGKWKQTLLGFIDQFHFGESITVTDVAGVDSRWLFVEPDTGDTPPIPQVLSPHKTVALDDEIRLCHHGKMDFGRTWITAWGRPARLAQWVERAFPQATVMNFEQLERWRIEAFRPRVGAEITDTTIPLEVGLIDALAANKGCYPGQEVIERILSQGAPARRLVQIIGEGAAPHVGDSISSSAEPPAELGKVTSAASQAGRFVALGFVRKIFAKEGLPILIVNPDSTETRPATIAKVAPYA